MKTEEHNLRKNSEHIRMYIFEPNDIAIHMYVERYLTVHLSKTTC